MPNKVVSGYTQVPVQAQDILMVRHDRLDTAGTQTRVTVEYQFRDNVGGGAVRGTAQLSFTSGAYPVAGATIIANCNAAQGT